MYLWEERRAVSMKLLIFRAQQGSVGCELTHYRIGSDDTINKCEDVWILKEMRIIPRFAKGERHIVPTWAPVFQVTFLFNVIL